MNKLFAVLTVAIVAAAALGIFVLAGSASAASDTVSRPGPGPRHACLAARFTVNAAADVLGMDKDDLVGALRSGQSLLEVAEAHGMDGDQFKAALLDEVKAGLDAKVSEGKISQERADKIYQAFEAHIDKIVNFHPDPDRHPCRPRAGAGPASSGDVAPAASRS